MPPGSGTEPGATPASSHTRPAAPALLAGADSLVSRKISAPESSSKIEERADGHVKELVPQQVKQFAQFKADCEAALADSARAAAAAAVMPIDVALEQLPASLSVTLTLATLRLLTLQLRTCASTRLRRDSYAS